MHWLNGEDGLQGYDTRNQAVSQIEGGQLRLFVSAKSSSAVPLIHLSEHLLDFCGIEDPQHVWLLHIVLTEPNDVEVEMAFAKRGLRVEVPESSHGRLLFFFLKETKDFYTLYVHQLNSRTSRVPELHGRSFLEVCVERDGSCGPIRLSRSEC